MKNILVTGSSGQLGSEIKERALNFPQYQFTFADIEELDLTNSEAVNTFFKEHKFDSCINCAAYTAVDNAEDDRELALLVNFDAVKNLAEACSSHNTFLVHISTDYVFDGTNYKPYEETDPPSPNSYYGLTKLKGEEAVFSMSDHAVIIRTSWLYSAYGNNFVKTMLRLGKTNEQIGVVADQVGTPTYAGDLADTILTILKKYDGKAVNEIYHFSNEGVTSWYDFAKAIFTKENIACHIRPIETKDYPTPAKRPPFSVLNKGKIKNVFDLQIPHWLESLEKCLNLLHQ